MRSPPKTILAYVAKWAVILITALITAADSPAVVAAVIVMGLALTELVRGSRIAWAFLVIVEVVALASAPLGRSPWWVFPLSVVALALLIVRPTRAHVA